MPDASPRFTVSRCNDKNIWEAFNASSSQGNIFCSPLFLDSLGIEYDLWICEKDGQIQAGAVILRKGDSVLNAPYAFSMYQGILFAGFRDEQPPHSKAAWTLEVLESLLTGLAEQYDRLSFCLHYSCDDIRGIQWFHYHEPALGQFNIGLRYTGLLELRTADAWETYISSLRKIRQREYKKAIKEGLTVEPSTDIEQLEALYISIFERQNITLKPETLTLVRSITSAALTQGFGELLMCKTSSGEAISALLYLFDGRNAYNLIAGNHPEYRNSGAGTFTQLEVIRRCCERDLTYLDFCGMNSPSRGDFKASFNANPAAYLVANYKSGSSAI